MNITEKFSFYYYGASEDYRTNVWQFVCRKCKKEFKPASTLMSTQQVECQKCGEREVINYNKAN